MSYKEKYLIKHAREIKRAEILRKILRTAGTVITFIIAMSALLALMIGVAAIENKNGVYFVIYGVTTLFLAGTIYEKTTNEYVA